MYCYTEDRICCKNNHLFLVFECINNDLAGDADVFLQLMLNL